MLLVEIKNPEGCYLIIMGLLLDSEVTIVSYYAYKKTPLPFISQMLLFMDSHKWGLFALNIPYTISWINPHNHLYTPLAKL